MPPRRWRLRGARAGWLPVAVILAPIGYVWATAPAPPPRRSAARADRPQFVLRVRDTRLVNSIAFSPDQRTLAASIKNGRAIRLWDCGTGALMRRTQSVPIDFHTAVVFCADGTQVAIGTRDGDVRRWNAATGKSLPLLTGFYGSPLGAIAFSPDGRWLAASNLYGVTLCDLRTQKWVRTWRAHDDFVGALAFSPDSQFLATGGSDETLSAAIWDVRTGQKKHVFNLYPSAPWRLAFSPDGTLLATGSCPIKLWGVKTGKLVRSVEHASEFGVMAFSPNGRLLAVGNAPKKGGFIQLWDVRSGRLRKSIPNDMGYVTSIAYSPCGRLLATAGGRLSRAGYGKSGEIRLWHPTSGRLLATLRLLPSERKGQITDNWLTYTPDGYYHGSASVDRFIGWRVRGKLVPAERYASRYHRPDRVRRALEGAR